MTILKKAWLFIIASTIAFMPFIAIESSASTHAYVADENRFIIGFREGFGPRDLGSRVPIDKQFERINAATARLPMAAVLSLMQHDFIEYIELDHAISVARPPFAQNPETPTWGLERIFQSETYPFETWETTDGAGVRVAVFDTGIDGTHEDLHVVGGFNTFNDDPYDVDPHGHGTHVAGIIAALHNDVGVVGVAPEVELYSVVVLDENGAGAMSNLVDGILWAIDNDIHIINMSLGTSHPSTALEDAINEANKQGHIIVASSGNAGEDGGEDTMRYPAKYEHVIAVGAINPDDTVADYSSYGQTLDLVAPGTSIRSTYPGNAYETRGGTSMAAPFVAGVIALMLGIDDSLTPSQVRAFLTGHAEDLGYSADKQGAGLLRADWVVSAVIDMADGLTYPVTVITAFDDTNNDIVYEGFHAYGTRIQFNQQITDTDEYTFAFWVVNGHVRFDLPVDHVFIVNGPMSIYAVFNGAETYAVMFMDTNGESIDLQYVDEGGDAVPPEALPDKPGFNVDEASPWNASYENITAHTILIIQYVIASTETFTVDVTHGVGGGTYLYNDIVELEADSPGDGEHFLYWETDGVKVSYNATYRFTALRDLTLTAVYGSEPIDTEPLITLSPNVNIRLGAYSYVGQFYVPQDHTLIEFGILRSNTNDAPLHGSADATRYRAEKHHAATNEYLMSFTYHQTYQRAYLVTEAADGTLHFTYSDVIITEP